MNVTELIQQLKDIEEESGGHLQVFFNDSVIEKPVSELKIEETVHPRGIKYLLINEEIIPRITELRKTDERFNINSPQGKEETPILTKKERKEFMQKVMTFHEEEPTTEFYMKKDEKKVKGKRGRPKKKITIEKEITIKEKSNRKCHHCHEPVEQGTGEHARIPNEKRRKLCHKKCHKEYKKEQRRKGKPLTEVSIRRKMQRDFKGYNRRCKKCGQGKPSTDYTKGDKWCKTCKEELRKKKELKT